MGREEYKPGVWAAGGECLPAGARVPWTLPAANAGLCPVWPLPPGAPLPSWSSAPHPSDFSSSFISPEELSLISTLSQTSPC